MYLLSISLLVVVRDTLMLVFHFPLSRMLLSLVVLAISGSRFHHFMGTFGSLLTGMNMTPYVNIVNTSWLLFLISDRRLNMAR